MAVPSQSWELRERKSFKIVEVKDKGEGRFHATANAYGVKDAYNEIVDPGCFKRSLDQQGPARPLLFNHNPDYLIGTGFHVETPNALEVKGELDLDTQKGRECYSSLKKGHLSKMSIGYNVLKDYFDEDGTRHLQEARLWESSLVVFPANEMSVVDTVKAYGYGRHDLPIILSGLTTLQGEVKQGRVLSQSNFNLIKQAASILQDLLTSVQEAEDSGKSHSPAPAPIADPQPAEQLSASEYRALMEVADIIRQAA